LAEEEALLRGRFFIACMPLKLAELPKSAALD
jgi:hypothetical protein